MYEYYLQVQAGTDRMMCRDAAKQAFRHKKEAHVSTYCVSLRRNGRFDTNRGLAAARPVSVCSEMAVSTQRGASQQTLAFLLGSTPARLFLFLFPLFAVSS